MNYRYIRVVKWWRVCNLLIRLLIYLFLGLLYVTVKDGLTCPSSAIRAVVEIKKIVDDLQKNSEKKKSCLSTSNDGGHEHQLHNAGVKTAKVVLYLSLNLDSLHSVNSVPTMSFMQEGNKHYHINYFFIRQYN